MSFSDSSNDSDWNISSSIKKNDSDEDLSKPTTKTLRKKRNFREKWLRIFSPWLTRSKDDPNLPFCRACQRTLGNNGYRLQRHEKTAKHARNQEILLNEGEDVVRKHLNRSTTKKLGPTMNSALDTDQNAMFETEIPFNQRHTASKRFKALSENYEFQPPYMYAKIECRQPTRLQHLQLLEPKKDSFDMFFEAISATVKRLPPKLAAEVKSRVSQVIAEFELRAICEEEAQERAQKHSVITIPSRVSNVDTVDAVIARGTNVGDT